MRNAIISTTPISKWFQPSLVRVTWSDPIISPGWTDAVAGEEHTCETIGWAVGLAKRILVVAGTKGPDDSKGKPTWADVTSIPLGTIVAVEKLLTTGEAFDVTAANRKSTAGVGKGGRKRKGGGRKVVGSHASEGHDEHADGRTAVAGECADDASRQSTAATDGKPSG